MKSVRWIWLFGPLALSAATFDADTYKKNVTYLASPELKGRATGSPELEKAAAFIASQFKAFHLKPVDGKNYEISFPADIGANMGPNNKLAFEEKGHKESLKLAEDFQPLSMSTSGKFSSGVVFAGYGITSKEQNYDDYAGLDVTGKLVLILRHEPQENNDHSSFDGRKLTSHATFIDKMETAKRHGAKGVLFINDLPQHPDSTDKLEEFGSTGGPKNSGIFFVQVKAATAEKWFEAEGKSLADIQKGIDADLRPRSFAFSNLHVNLDVDLFRINKTVHNVAGYLPGSTQEYVIIGAHYDHLGTSVEYSLAPNAKGQIHPGADDNASGTAGVIELARYFSSTYSDKNLPKRGILFMTFAGEEIGLLGSSWYANHPLLPIENAVAMLNLDMIGRIREGRVFMSGSQTGGPELSKLIAGVPVPASLRVDETGKNSGTNMNDASDHASFVAKKVPSLFFFSGLHGDYHKPTDTPDKIDAEDAVKLLDYVAGIANALSAAPDRPSFVKVEAAPPGPVSGNGGRSGYGADFGSIPDFNEPPKGVRFADVRAGSPAAKADLRAGDILIEFDGKEMGNLYDFTYALRDHNPGDEVLVKVLRSGQTIVAKVLLTQRR
ncbi:MAG: M28 family peptidase [Bryobacteraceae bacterium]